MKKNNLPQTESGNSLHKSVMVQEVLTYLNPQPGKVYIDATFGTGGHTSAILDREPTCKVIAFDWDRETVQHRADELQHQYGDRLKVLWGNFAHLQRLLKKENIPHVDGILADFGTSQLQIFEKEGFSFRTDTSLDMRMSPAHQRTTAADIVNNYSQNELAKLFWEYGEEPCAIKIARTIVETRKKKKISSTQQLAHLIETALRIPSFSRKKIHPATKVFQALRIKVNHELENIESFLQATLSHLNDQARIVCISFHSLEDRIVKNFFKDHKAELQILTPKPLQALPEETTVNPSARSAKLRAASFSLENQQKLLTNRL